MVLEPAVADRLQPAERPAWSDDVLEDVNVGSAFGADPDLPEVGHPPAP